MRKFYGRMAALVFAFGLAVAASAAHAGPYEDALQGFTEGSLHDTGAAIDKVVASGNPLAETLLKALKDARLMYSAEQKKVFIQTGDDKLIDAATGKPFTGKAPDDIDNVIVNNRLRNVINAALGSLTLMSPNADARYKAAQAVFKSRDLSALPALDKALAKETDPRVKAAFQQARAAIILDQKDAKPEAKIAAIAVIRDRGDQDALGLLDGLPPACRPRWCRRPQAAQVVDPRTRSNCGARCRTPGTGSRSARCCCSRPSASPSPSASWASSTWRMARW